MHSSFYQQLVEIDGALFEGFLVLFFALLLARLAPLPREMQPLIWFSHLAKQLAAKVNRSERSPSQQATAGFLAMLLLVFPFWAIITFLLELAAFPWFFEFLGFSYPKGVPTVGWVWGVDSVLVAPGVPGGFVSYTPGCPVDVNM